MCARMDYKESILWFNWIPRNLIPGNVSGESMTQLSQLFEDLVRAETRLYNAIDDRLRTEHDLSLGQYEFMAIINRRGQCRVFDIVHEIGITVGAVSKSVDRLESADWCRRTNNPADRRSSLLSLTAAGSRLLARARPTVEAELAARVRGIGSPHAVQQTAKTLAALRSALEAHQQTRAD
jgi:DNA-binding MarR family transcriptional regulator